MDKTTNELKHEIKEAVSIDAYLMRNEAHLLRRSVAEHLMALLAEKGITRADVVRGSLLDRAYVYQIFSGEKTPSRDKLIALAFGLGLTDEETQRMLKLSGNRELYAKDKRDALILFALQRGYSIWEANDMLYEHEQSILGNA